MSPPAKMRVVLTYDYVAGIVEKRTPFREAHLGLAREHAARGELLMAGAWADTVDGALFVFEVESPAVVEAFVARDPYVANGLVTAWRIRPWNVVIDAVARE